MLIKNNNIFDIKKVYFMQMFVIEGLNKNS